PSAPAFTADDFSADRARRARPMDPVASAVNKTKNAWERSQTTTRRRIPTTEGMMMSELAISRRRLLQATAVGAGALALGELALGQRASAAGGFYKGCDVSWTPQMEAAGYYWKNSSGVKQDLFTILKGYGINAIRLRTFVNPSSSPQAGHCSA